MTLDHNFKLSLKAIISGLSLKKMAFSTASNEMTVTEMTGLSHMRVFTRVSSLTLVVLWPWKR